jgi:hypothetical protein
MPVKSRRQARSPAVATERALSCLASAETWPELGKWDERRRALAAIALNRLGVEQRADDLLGASRILNALGPDSFAEFAAVRVPGRIVWCNFDLARQLGFDVPSENQLTAEFHNQLVTMLSLNVAGPLDGSHLDHGTVTMYADKYGGDGVRPALGAGRAGFLPFGNLYIKGVGFTPLFKHDDPDDFVHSHGAVHLEDCLSEAVFGEVNENLFTHGSTRVLAIIDQGKHVKAPNGKRIPVALLVRAGLHLRPAHLLGTNENGSLFEKFVRIVRATGQLVKRYEAFSGNHVPDVKATMLRIIEDHARTSAEGFRWRMIHGALSSSNMEMSGAMLDLPTQSAQSRTAPIWSLDNADSVFGTEHAERALRLASVYNALLRKTPRPLRELYNVKWINILGQMEKAYSRQLRVQLLRATGLKTEVAQRMQTERTELALRFTELILQMASLKNPGTTCASKSATEFVSVLDIFNLLKSFPAKYFANPGADHRQTISDLLLPVFRGNRFHISRRKATAEILISNFAVLYAQVMNASRDYAKEYYGDLKSMEESIVARATFENAPLDALYSSKLYRELSKTISGYKATSNAEIIRQAIDQRIVASLRSVDALLAEGNSRRLVGGGIELEMRTIDGINYSVLAWHDKDQTRRVRVRIPIKREGLQYVCAVPGLGQLTKRRIYSLRFRYTTDGWKTSAEVRARLRCDDLDGLVIDFDELSSLPLVGRLEGTFCDEGPRNFATGVGTTIRNGYVFAIPDKRELLRIAAISSGGSRIQ